ncbi:hypothetical protein C8F01DRAFT_976810 [Mycena amicta]|nr:hypothetical protein C8F01DRAFT_976810 [Mycena amicta]
MLLRVLPRLEVTADSGFFTKSANERTSLPLARYHSTPLTGGLQYVGFAGFTILIWDHLDTLTTEVEYIWKGKKGILVYLFLLVSGPPRSYLSPTWTIDRYVVACAAPLTCPNVALTQCACRCRHFIRYEGSMTLIGIHVVALMMLLRYVLLSSRSAQDLTSRCFRIHAMYSSQRLVVGGVAFLFLVTFTMNAWLLTRGQDEHHLLACTMIFPPNMRVRLHLTIASSSAWLPLLYDSAVLALTLVKTLPLVAKRNGTYIMKRILEDGLIYYSAIFSVTLVLTLMIISAPPGTSSFISASHIIHLQVTMMSRITLNLKKCARKRLNSTIIRDPGPLVFSPNTDVDWPSTGRTPHATLEARVYRNPPGW